MRIGRIVPFIVKRNDRWQLERWRMDEKYRMRPKGAIETASQDHSRIPLASFHLSVHDPCDIDASPSYFIGAIPRSFRNCTRGGGPQNILPTLFSRHSELTCGKKRATIIEIVLHVSLLHTSSRWEEFVLRFFFFRKISHYLCIYVT